MKSQTEIRLECIKLATALATAKLVQADQVIPTAAEYLQWIDGDVGLSKSELLRRYGIATKPSAS